MAMSSAGVQVNVIDESFYTSAAPGTTPLIIVASKTNKTNSSGTGIAPGTLASNAGKVYTITSQRDLSDTFGTPYFYTDSNSNPIHGGELNEYGLQAAYSTLGVTSRAYVVRADVNLSELVPKTSEPTGLPAAGTYWIDTTSSKFGISEWNATTKVFINKTPRVINDVTLSLYADANRVPLDSFGNQGDYAVVVTNDNRYTMYFKNVDNVWVRLGSNIQTTFGNPIVDSRFVSNCWQTSWPIVKGTPTQPSSGSRFAINDIEITITDPTVDGIARSINALTPQAGVGAKSDGTNLYLYADASAQSDQAAGPNGKIALVNRGGSATLASLGLEVGVFGPLKLTLAPHYQFPQYASQGVATGSVYVKTTSPNSGANWVVKYFNGTESIWETVNAPVFKNSREAIKSLDSSGGTNIAAGKLFIQSDYNEGNGTAAQATIANFKLYRRVTSAPTVVTTVIPNTSAFAIGATFIISETEPNSTTLGNPKTVVITTSSVAGFATAVSAVGLKYVTSTYDPVSGVLRLEHSLGGEIFMSDGIDVPLFQAGFYDSATNTYASNVYPTGLYDGFALKASNWKPVELLTSVVKSSATALTTAPADGTLWYSAIQDEVDILVHNGTTWAGYHSVYPLTSPNGPIIKATAPGKDDGQSDGTPLVDGDLWIDSSDPEKYGQNVYVWSASLIKWVKQDLSDNTSPTGWLFADARWGASGTATTPATIKALLTSLYLDPDAPDPTIYPQGMRLWNTRRSGNNVKQYKATAIDITADNGTNQRFNDEVMDGSTNSPKYATARWVSASGNNEDGSGKFGRHSQRGFVVKSLKSLIDTSLSIRDTDTMVVNLLACPGYPETITNLVGLNVARGLTGFVIGDTPFRLPATGTALREWGASNTALDNGETGSVTYDEYMGMFYPSGFTTDNSGNSIVVPPSHMVLRTMALSDQKSYPWFAPAGTRRGGVDNATAVGYLKNGEFQQAPLPQSLRDVLQDVKINPIATLPGAGIVLFGQKTRARNSSSLDRINVSRLVAYLRRQLDLLARPFLFEPNDRTTRNELKQSAESLLLELVGQRALYDFIVVCDESNNTPARVDRNELYLDIAIEPVKAVEFIYIPLRLKNTGDIAAGR